MARVSWIDRTDDKMGTVVGLLVEKASGQMTACINFVGVPEDGQMGQMKHEMSAYRVATDTVAATDNDNAGHCLADWGSRAQMMSNSGLMSEEPNCDVRHFDQR